MKPILLLDPGHGGHLPGAIGEYVEGGGEYSERLVQVLEKDINLAIALYTRRYIQQNAEDQIVTYMTRKTDEHKSLIHRCNRALTLDPDLFVSIHCNAFEEVDDTDPGVTGIETYYYWPDVKPFANRVQENLMTAFSDHKNRGVKKVGYKVIRDGVPESVLVECEFIDEMPEFLEMVEVQRKFGAVIGRAIMEHLL